MGTSAKNESHLGKDPSGSGIFISCWLLDMTNRVEVINNTDYSDLNEINYAGASIGKFSVSVLFVFI